MTGPNAKGPDATVRESETIRTLVVDDEALARKSLLRLLDGDPSVTVVGECAGGMEAVAAIDELAPDLVFLDIQMPEVDGFGVLRRLPAGVEPEIVFVTAHDRYTLRAFEVHALDYLLKPVSRERFRQSLEHAKRRIEERRRGTGSGAPWRELADDERLAQAHVTRLRVRRTGRIRWIETDEIDWIEAADYYVRLHVGDESHLIRKSLKALEDELDSRHFVRVHRSAIVRADRVKEIRRRPGRGHRVVLRDGTEIRMSRGRLDDLERLLR